MRSLFPRDEHDRRSECRPQTHRHHRPRAVDQHVLVRQELSTQYEGLDNIVAFWDPKVKPAPLQPKRFAYTLYWTLEEDMKLSQNRVISTRIGAHPRNAARSEE